ncbi:MAG: CBS domain-containing protein, partial [Candidatus Methylomirabilis sp.]|nr:CBS domain-containing protein [Deltaproteobacteria bacterium]
VVFAFETTRQPFGLLPLLGGCAAAYVVSSLLMRQSIMTEKLARRGARVATDLAADFLDGVFVRDWASRPAVCLAAEDPLERVREWLASGAPGSQHQAFPVVNKEGSLVGLVDRTALADPAASDETKVGDLVSGPAPIAYEDNSLREAADHMVLCGVGRLAVVRREAPREVVGVISRSDLLAAHRGRLEHARLAERVVRPSAREDAGSAATPTRL